MPLKALRTKMTIPYYSHPVRPRVLPIASTQTLSLSQTPLAGVPSTPVPTGLSRRSHQLRLTGTLQKNQTSKLRTALECISSRAITILDFADLSLCLSVRPHPLYFRIYICLLQMMFIRRIRHLQTLYTETYIPYHQTLFGHIIYPPQRTTIPYHQHTI